MSTIERWTDDGAPRLRYLDNGGDPRSDRSRPIVFVPGIVDHADDYGTMLEALLPRRVLVLELRGRGRSGRPTGEPADFSAQAHADDVGTVLAHAGVDDFHLMTFSRGTSYALEALLRRPGRVRTVSIGDYWAREHGVDPAFTDEYMTGHFRGRPLVERIDTEVVRAVFAQSVSRNLLPNLAATGIPVLVAVGTEADRVVKEAEVDEFRAAIPGVRVVVIEGAGHDLFRRDRTAYARAVDRFATEHDPRGVRVDRRHT